MFALRWHGSSNPAVILCVASHDPSGNASDYAAVWNFAEHYRSGRHYNLISYASAWKDDGPSPKPCA